MNAEFTINGSTIETERLLLRAFRNSDLEDFYAYASVPGVGEMAGWHHHTDIADSQKILDSFIRHDKVFAVVYKGTGKVIGSLGVEEYGLEDSLTEFHGFAGRELGFVLSKEYWGQGLMPEAVSAVIDYLFRERKLDFLLCGHYDFNSQSKKVQEKCGFRPYRKLVMDTAMGTSEPGVLNLLVNPEKQIEFQFSHPETLIYAQENRSIVIDPEVTLIPYYPNYEEALVWYQDPTLCKQVDNIDEVYSIDRLRGMYTFLSTHGDCFYIQYCGKLVGDVTLRDNNEVCIVVCREYQNRRIGRRCIQGILRLAKQKGCRSVKANIYDFNTQSQKMFQSVGFRKISDEWYEYRIAE